MNGQQIRKIYRDIGVKVSVKDTIEGLQISLVSDDVELFQSTAKSRFNADVTGGIFYVNPMIEGANRVSRQLLSAGWDNPFKTRLIVWKYINEYEFRYFKRLVLVTDGMGFEFNRDEMEVNLFIDGEYISSENNKDAYTQFRKILLLGSECEVMDYSLIEMPHWGVIARGEAA